MGGTLLDERGAPVQYTRSGSSYTRHCFGGAPGVARALAAHDWSSVAGQGYGALKKEVVELVVDGLRPLQDKFAELSKDSSYVEGILKDSAERIRPMARQTMSAASQAMGLG